VDIVAVGDVIELVMMIEVTFKKLSVAVPVLVKFET
jgi:hypothetical protein